MVTPRRILCLSALLAVLLTASAGAAGEGSVPAAFWQEGTLYAFARLTEDPAGAEPRLQLGTADLTLPAEGPLARSSACARCLLRHQGVSPPAPSAE